MMETTDLTPQRVAEIYEVPADLVLSGEQPMPPRSAWVTQMIDGLTAEIVALIPLWEEAHTRGWRVDIDPDKQTWRIESADGSSYAGYEPPGEICTGVVKASDSAAGATMTLTGISTNAGAVEAVRGFLGWSSGGTSEEGR